MKKSGIEMDTALCSKCLRFSLKCPYEHQPTTITNNGRGFIRTNNCDSYIDLTNAKYEGKSSNECPHCHGHDIFRKFERFECNTCGRLFH